MNSLHLSQPPLAAPADAGDSGATGGFTQARTTVAKAASQIKSAAAETAARARSEAQRVATEKKETAARRLGGYSSAIHDSAKSLEEEDPNIAWFTHRVADKVQGVADYVRDRDFDELRADAEDFARRHPAVFFGGLFVAGLLLGNVAKASRRTVNRESDETSERCELDSANDPMRDAEAREALPDEDIPTAAPSAATEVEEEGQEP
jgi:hypothetical protein